MKFISFEGIEKVGKTTNIKFMASLLLKNKYKVRLTREPGGTHIGEKLRKILLERDKHSEMSFITELLLLLSARYQNLEEIIIPSIMKNEIVLCDRYIDSTYAYQSGGRGIEISKIKILQKLFFYEISPDFVFLLNYPIKKSFFKIKNGGKVDRIEKEKMSFFIKVKKVYIKRAILKKNKYFILNCDSNLYNIQEKIKNIMKKIRLMHQ